jgi:hypothetical protein
LTLSTTRPAFTPEYRAKIVAEVESGRSVAEVAEEHSLRPRQLQRWVRSKHLDDVEAAALRRRRNRFRLGLCSVVLVVAAVGFLISHHNRVAMEAPLMGAPPIAAVPAWPDTYRDAIVSQIRIELQQDWSLLQRLGWRDERPHMYVLVDALVPTDGLLQEKASWFVTLPPGFTRSRTFTVQPTTYLEPDPSTSGVRVVTGPDSYSFGDWQRVGADGTIVAHPVAGPSSDLLVDGKLQNMTQLQIKLHAEFESALHMGFDPQAGLAKEVWGLAWSDQALPVLRGFEEAGHSSAGVRQVRTTGEPVEVQLVVCKTCFPQDVSDSAARVAPGTYQAEVPFTSPGEVNFTRSNPPWSWLLPSYRWILGGVLIPAVAGLVLSSASRRE